MNQKELEIALLLFFRKVLEKLPYFNTSAMRCCVKNMVNEAAITTLQIPLKTGSKLPNDHALGQLVAQLLHNECVVKRRELNDYAFAIISGSIPANQTCRYNKSVDDSICYFMYYQIQVKTDNQKAVINVVARLDTALMQTFYLYL